MTRLDDQSAKSVDAPHNFGKLIYNWMKLFQMNVDCGRILKCEVVRCCVALGRQLTKQRFPSGVEIRLHAMDLPGILFIGAALEARRQAHLHLGIDASRE